MNATKNCILNTQSHSNTKVWYKRYIKRGKTTRPTLLIAVEDQFLLKSNRVYKNLQNFIRMTICVN